MVCYPMLEVLKEHLPPRYRRQNVTGEVDAHGARLGRI